jgi:hypothetical protein
MGEILSKINLNTKDSNSPPNNENAEDNQENLNNLEEKPTNNEPSHPTSQNLEIGALLSKMPQILSQFSSKNSEESLATKQQIALLLAIRPYLSDRRKELIDTFIKMNKLGVIFKKINTKEG